MRVLHLLIMKDDQVHIQKTLLIDENLQDRVMWFDQDVLNSYLNGMYNELPAQLNYTDIYSPISEVREEAIFTIFGVKRNL